MSERVSFSLKNDREEELPIFIDPWPEFYKLRKGEALTVVFESRSERALEIVAHDEGLTLFPNFAEDPEITINGKDASSRSWID